MKISPGATFGGAHGALRAPGGGMFSGIPVKTPAWGHILGGHVRAIFQKAGGVWGAARPPQDKIILGGVGSPGRGTFSTS